MEKETKRQTETQDSPVMGGMGNMSEAKTSDVDFLHTIYKNAETGISSIDTIVKHVSDQEMKDVLLDQFDDYEKFRAKISKHITEMGETPKKNNPFSKATMWSSINFSALMDDSPSHIADMMIKGSNMGITTLTKELNAAKGMVGETTVRLANELLTIEQSNIEQLKPFL